MFEPISFERLDDGARYYFADRILVARNATQFADALLKEDPGPRAAFVTGGSFGSAPGQVRSWRETARSIEVDVDATGRSLLVLSVTPHRYWRASVDGRPVSIVRVNVGYSGIALGPGAHRVRLDYRNPVVIVGAELSLVALLTLCSIAVASRRRERVMR
jgi:hypothetical protein